MGRALQMPFRNDVISHAYSAPVTAGLHLSQTYLSATMDTHLTFTTS